MIPRQNVPGNCHTPVQPQNTAPQGMAACGYAKRYERKALHFLSTRKAFFIRALNLKESKYVDATGQQPKPAGPMCIRSSLPLLCVSRCRNRARPSVRQKDREDGEVSIQDSVRREIQGLASLAVLAVALRYRQLHYAGRYRQW